MICIECCHPTDSLYTVYSNHHIQLTDCKNCHNVVDRYVEIDNVLLFIDLLLLKHDAYRHLVYNSLEETLLKYDQWKPITSLSVLTTNVRNWILKFDQLNRLWILLLTFEIYLMWVTEEQKKPWSRSLLTGKVLLCEVQYQYLYFALYCLIDISIFHYLTQFCIISWIKWGQNINFAKHIISYTILISYCAKIFPILMLIWPYDTILSMSIIKWIANIYIVEALRIVTRLPYWKILGILLFVSLCRFVLATPILIFLTCLATNDFDYFTTYLYSEVVMELYWLNSLKKYFFL
ncbi:hypothetical protein NCAS_0C02850 [Naumovozyma castellii]|uniref:Protein ARV n=1 Tax=Naumovozyma castellii TaxID=27288 RepID=G0VCR5_NAUCA|nr:hypothetical protein NCAS_0C02850 [Naumovozyma castellii CBS 4309]CCC69275.1 hypothetical protein NCAS_0C02850 [Naumovozyma castellii CBS 4309]